MTIVNRCDFYVVLFHLLALGCAVRIVTTAVWSMEISTVFYDYLYPFPLHLFYVYGTASCLLKHKSGRYLIDKEL